METPLVVSHKGRLKNITLFRNMFRIELIVSELFFSSDKFAIV